MFGIVLFAVPLPARTIMVCALCVILGAETSGPLCTPLLAEELHSAPNSYFATTTQPSSDDDGLIVQRFLLKLCAPIVEHYPAALWPEDLTLANFFSEGWTQGWSEPEEGPEDAPRFRLLRIQRAFWERELRLTYNFTFRGDRPSADEQEGAFELELPISRRFLIEFEGGTVALQPDKQSWRTRNADLAVTPEVMLAETHTLSFSSGMAVRTPTGGDAAAQGRTSITPYLALWKDLGHRIGLHTFIGGEIPLGGFESGAPKAIVQYALAPTITVTSREKPYLGDLTFFVEVNGDTNVQGSDNGATSVSFLPGTRWMVLNGLWFATGYEIFIAGTDQTRGRLWASLYLDF